MSIRTLATAASVMLGSINGVQATEPTPANAVQEAIFVRLTAKPGKEAEVAQFLAGALPLVNAEPGTAVWFAVQFDAQTFAIFDAFADEASRQAHLAGKVAAALMAQAPDLFSQAPHIETAHILAKKIAND